MLSVILSVMLGVALAGFVLAVWVPDETAEKIDHSAVVRAVLFTGLFLVGGLLGAL